MTTIVEGSNGIFTYTDENGATTNIDVKNLETLTSIALNPDNTNIDYTDEDGVTTQLDLTNVVQNLETLTTIVEGSNGIFTYTDENGGATNIDVKNLETLTTIALNADNTNIDYTDEDGVTNQINLSTFLDNTDAQTITLDNTTNILTLSNGTTSDTTANLSVYLDNTDSQGLSNSIVTLNQSIEIQITNGTNTTIDIRDADADPTNEHNTGIAFDGTSLTITDSGGDQTIDISGVSTDDQNLGAATLTGENLEINIENGTNTIADLSDFALDTDVTAVQNDVNQNETDSDAADAALQTALNAHITADLDTDPTNEHNTGIAFDGTSLTITDSGGDQTIDISGVSTDDQNLGAATLTGENLEINIENGTNTTADLSDFALDTDVTAVQNDVNQNETDSDAADAALQTALNAHITADLDTDPTNEHNTGIAFDGTSLTITDSGGDQTIDISGVSTDDQNLGAATLTGENLEINIENGTNTIADLSDFALDTDVTAVQNDVNQNETDSDAADAALQTALNAHITADLDTDPTNEHNTGIAFDGTSLTITDSGGDQTIDISGVSTDDQNLGAATLTGENLEINIENGTNTTADLSDFALDTDVTAVQNDVNQNETDSDAADAALQTALNAHITADLDTDPTNEHNTGIAFDGTSLTITDSGGDQTIDISGVSTDDQNLGAATLTGENLEINIENGTNTTADLSDFALDTDVTAVQNDVNQNETDSDAADAALQTALNAHITADLDTDPTNEHNTGIAFDGTSLTITDSGGDQTIDISGVSTDDQNLGAATLTGENLEINIENGTNTTADLSDFALDTDVTAVQNDVNQNETDSDAADAALQTALNAHITADLDTDPTNEHNTGIAFDGTSLTITDSGGDQTIDISGVSTDDQNLGAATLTGENLEINIENGTNTTADLSDFALDTDVTAVQNDVNQNETDSDAADAALQTALNAHITADLDTDPTNEHNTGIAFDGTSLTITDSGGDQTIDISGVSTDDQNLGAATLTGENLEINIENGTNTTADLSDFALDTDVTAVQNDVNQNETDSDAADAALQTALNAHITADLDTDPTNEHNTGIAFDGTSLTITDSGGDQTIDISGVSTDDQNLGAATLTGENLEINIENGTNTTADLSDFALDTDVTAVQNDVNQNETDSDAADAALQTALNAHITADLDTDPTNEHNTGIAFDGTSLTITDSGGDQTIDISGVSTDDQNLGAATLTGENLEINIENGTNTTADLSDFALDTDVTAVQNDVNQNETDSDAADAALQTALNAHITADLDTDPTNEHNTGIAFDGTSLTITDSGGDQTIDISGVSTDDQNLGAATLTGENLEINIENGTNTIADLSDFALDTDVTAVQNDVNQNETDSDAADAALQTALNAHITADLDTDPTNEHNTGIAFDGTSLTITDSGGDQTIDISGVSTDDQNLGAATLTGENLEINIENGTNTTADLSDFALDTDVTAVQNDVNQNETDSDAADAALQTALNAHITADLDTDPTNEHNTGIAFDGTSLTITDSGGDQTIDISGVSTDDQNLGAATLTGENLEINIENGTNTIADLSDFALDTDVTAVQNDVNQNETDSDAADAALQTALNAHITADLDTDPTNEHNTGIAFDGTSLTITDSGGDQTIDISGVSTDDQNLGAATLTGENLEINIENGTNTTADLSDFALDTDVTAVQNDVNQNETDSDAADAALQTALNAHITADLDTDPTNEHNTGIAFDGTSLTITDSGGDQTIDISGVSTDDQNLGAATLTGENLEINIENGTNTTADLSDFALDTDVTAVQNDVNQNETDSDAADAALQTALNAHITADLDTDPTNEHNTGIAFDGTSLTITDSGGDQTIDISGVSTDDQNLGAATLTGENLEINIENGTNTIADLSDFALDTDVTAVQNDVNQNETDSDAADAALQTALNAHITADLDTDPTNEHNTGIAFDGTSLTITDSGGDQTIDISGVSTDDQNLGAATLTGENLEINIENGTNTTADLSDFALDTDVTAVQNDVNQNETDSDAADAALQTALNAHITADLDTDPTNEHNTGIAFDGTSLTITDSGGDQTIDISGVSTDDQNLGAATLTGENLEINIENGTNTIADLSDFALDTDVTAVQNDVNQNETDSDAADAALQTALNAHITADLDTDPTNEHNTGIAFDGTSLTITDSGGDQTIDISGVSTDDQNLGAATLTGENLEINIENGTNTTADLSDFALDTDVTAVQNDVNQNETDSDAADAALQTALNAHITADLDTDPTNEHNTGIAFDGTSLTITDSGGDQTIDISGVSTDDQNLGAATLTGENLEINIENGTNTTADLSDFALDTDVTAVQNDVNQNETDSDAADAALQTALNAHITADLDTDPTNEHNTGIAFDGTSLTITDSGGDQTIDISGVSTDDQNLGAATLTGENLEINIENGTNTTADLSDFALDTDVTAVQNDVNQNETDSDAADAALQTALNAHITADLDTDPTNEVGTYTNTTTGTTHKIGEYRATPTATSVDVNETVTSLSQNTTTGVITYSNETATNQTANVVAAETDNKLTVGANGGAYFAGPVTVAAGKVSGAGTALKIYGATVTRVDEGDYQVTFTTPRSDANYVIQLSIADCAGDCPGNTTTNYDDPGVTYYQQTANGFRVNIGDSDNGGNQKDDIDLEFMFNVIDF
ncbi:beta strand repeat-containing protein [Tenacibaculum sp. MAR_2009_124]|uniref:beta strand repeat-containing protein n=1 Tax=Tenacibaculum sp. MAR_2009_124 TaxID=1250059 RepID=UPI00115FADF9|nr:hypothetical protein [Tenacibaculum sp. MAR_2009_124]